MRTQFSAWFLLLCLILCLSNSGCVRRRMTVRSWPEGAQVYVDDHPIGLTPVSTNFTYYGTRRVKVVKDGYKTTDVQHTFFPPWYEVPPLDFFSEVLWPGEKRDEHRLNFTLEPQEQVQTDELIRRGELLRQAATPNETWNRPHEPLPFGEGPAYQQNNGPLPQRGF